MMPKSRIPGTPTTIGCPDCSGVLNAAEEGTGHHRRYVCQVGHSFSLHSLLEAKENQLEETLWSAVSLLQHVEMICGELKAHPHTQDLRQQLDRRIQQVRAHEEAVSKVIHDGGPPSIDDAGKSRS
jgi:two-component system chemotaxis response regulator CheB